MLTHWLRHDDVHPLLLLRAPARFGKSALAWQWLSHDLDAAEQARIVWWRFREEDASFESCMARTLERTSGLRPDVAAIPARTQLDTLFQTLESRSLIIVLDGCEHLLRAGDGDDREARSTLADLFLRRVASLRGGAGKVLLTSRVQPISIEARDGTPLPGCRVEDLSPPPADGDASQREPHALEQAYGGMSRTARRLLNRLACSRRPASIDALAGRTPPRQVAADLRDLTGRGLLFLDASADRVDLDDELRQFVRGRLSVPQRRRIHADLRAHLAASPLPSQVRCLDDLAPAIDLYHHMIESGQRDAALTLVKEGIEAGVTYLVRYGHCAQSSGQQLLAEILSALMPREAGGPRLREVENVHWMLQMLTAAYSLGGQSRRAAATAALGVHAAREVSEKDAAVAMFTAVFTLLPIGALPAAESNARASLALAQQIADPHRVAVGRIGLGLVLAHRGRWDAAESELAAALDQFAATRLIRSQGGAWIFRATNEVFRLRSTLAVSGASALGLDRTGAIAPAQRALDFADAWTHAHYAMERDYVRVHWLLGAAHRLAGHADEAAHHLHEALTRCRRLDMVDHEAPVLTELAALEVDLASTRPPASASLDAAERLIDDALHMAARCENVLQSADAYVVRARIAIVQARPDQARADAYEARRLAACEAAPGDGYKAACDEADAVLRLAAV